MHFGAIRPRPDTEGRGNILHTPGQWMRPYADCLVSSGLSAKWHSRDITYGISVDVDMDKRRPTGEL
jgi:hypothetical protein